MEEDKKGVSTLSKGGVIFSVFLISVSLFFERWKQFVMLSLLWFLFSGKRYRFLYMVVKTLPRDARAVLRFGMTLAEFFYWRHKGGALISIFLSNVKRNPNKVAFQFQDETWTFQQVEDYSNQVANFFKSQGIKRGDSIGLFMENRPEVVCLWLGLAKIGAVTALINTNQRTTVLSHSISAGNCTRMICGTELLEALLEVLSEKPKMPIYLSGKTVPLVATTPNCKNLELVLPRSPKTPLLEDVALAKMRDNFLLIYTSGTTGLPKAAKMSHARFFMIARGMFNMLWLKNDDIVYNTLPLYHTAGGVMGVGQVLVNGLTVALRTKFSASNFWTDCIKYNCTVAQYIGEICRFLLASPEKPEQKAHKVRLITGNGMRPQIWESFTKRFNIQEVGEFYGSTEGNCNMINSENKVGSVGFLPWFSPALNPYYLIRADPHTNEPIRGKDGYCIESRCGEPGILIGKVKRTHPFSEFVGYADKKATEKKVLKDVFKKGDEYFNSGDILVKDEFGFFFFKDRTGDTFRWRGENVATSEVEAVISNVVGLKDAIVYGVEVPHSEGRAGMAAIVDPDNTLDMDKLAEGVRRSLPAYARPLFVRKLHSAPLTGTFKLQKVDLQKEGYNVNSVKDPLYFYKGSSYVPLTCELYEDIASGKLKL